MIINLEDEQVVGVDLDGVIIDHTQNKIRFAKRYGIDLTPERTHAEFMEWYVDPERYKEIKGQIYEHSPEALEAPLMEGAFDALARMKERGVTVYLISLQKNPMHALHLIEERGLWGKYFTPENTYFAGDKEEKHHIALSLGVTHFVDDEPNVLDIMEHIPKRILFDNRSLFGRETDFLRARNWNDVLELLEIGH